MDGKQGTHRAGRQVSPSIAEHNKVPLANEPSESASEISLDLLQRLVHLLDRSDVSELELKRPEEGTYLVLRKAKSSDNNGQLEATALNSRMHGAPPDTRLTDSSAVVVETKHSISSHLVGIFHAWAKPRGGTLVAVGDRVKVGQLVATIESLNVINDVETPFAGQVVEILVHEGQPVEYGQKLMVIDSSTEGESA